MALTSLQHKHFLALLFVGMAITITSCERDRMEMKANTIGIESSTAENLFADMFNVVDNVSSSTPGIREEEFGCIDTIIADTVAFPRTLLIDFGNDNCVGADGRARNGQIQVTYTGRYRETGTVITMTTNNYTVNGYLVAGTHTVTNLGPSIEGQLVYSVEVDGEITAPDNAWSSTWQSNRTRIWIEGQNTPTIWDDVYNITGSTSGINRNDVYYEANITVPLRAEVGCRWIVSGAVLIQPEGMAVRTIDFGNGECNNGITVTVNGHTTSYGTE